MPGRNGEVLRRGNPGNRGNLRGRTTLKTILRISLDLKRELDRLEDQAKRSVMASVLGAAKYRGPRLSSVGVAFVKVDRPGATGGTTLLQPAIVFVPEYQPNGQFRLVPLEGLGESGKSGPDLGKARS